MMTIHTELLKAGVISGIYLLIFVSAELWRVIGKPKTETTRKFVHFAAGAVCLSFAYLFTSHLTILGLGILFLLVMIITKKTGLLQSVHDVERRTGGSLYYPIAVYLCFLIAHNAEKPEFYLIAILVLALSDSLAALIGGQYGLKLYKVEENHKSLEGSVVFFFSTFIIVLLGLLLLSKAGRAESILIAMYVALMITAFEAIALNGADNLFIPIGTLVILLNITDESVPGLLIQLGVIVLIFLIVFCIVRYTKVIGLSGIIGIALTGYAAWMLVSYDWVFPVIVSLLLYGLTDLFIETSANNKELYRIRTVFYVALVSFIWILVASYIKLPKEIFFVPFAINLSAHLGILWHRKARLDPDGYYIPLPQWIRNPHIVTRATILVMVLTSANLFVNKNLIIAPTLILSFIGTITIELIYWQVESRYRGKLTDIQFLKITSLIIMVISALICIPAIMIYYPEFFSIEYWH